MFVFFITSYFKQVGIEFIICRFHILWPKFSMYMSVFLCLYFSLHLILKTYVSNVIIFHFRILWPNFSIHFSLKVIELYMYVCFWRLIHVPNITDHAYKDVLVSNISPNVFFFYRMIVYSKGYREGSGVFM